MDGIDVVGDVDRPVSARAMAQGHDHQGDHHHAGHGARPGKPWRREERTPGGAAPLPAPALAPTPGLLHELPAQLGAEGRVGGDLGGLDRGQDRGQAPVLGVGEELVELLEVAAEIPRAHRTRLGAAPTFSRIRVTPRWMSSFTAPGLLPMTAAMSSIFMSSWNLRTIAARWGAGRVSTSRQIWRTSSFKIATSSRAGPRSDTATWLSMSSVGFCER